MYSYSDKDTICAYKTILQKLTLNSLQVQGNFMKKTKKNNSQVSSKGKSTCLSTLQSGNGSFTIEAAIVSLFLLFGMIILLHFIFLINFQNILNQNMINTAWDISRYTYTAQRTGNIIKKDTGMADEKDSRSDKLSQLSVSETLIRGGLTSAYALNKILDNELKKLAKDLGIFMRLSEIKMMESDFFEQENVDLAVSYTAKIPMLSSNVYKMSFINRCYFRNFIGESIDVKSKSFLTKVYITKSGTVYHTNKDCTHINLSVVFVEFSQLPLLRNKGGGKYKKCERCVKYKIKGNEHVIITTSGDRYHTEDRCSGIIRDVISIDINQVGDRKLCKRCKESERS